MDDRQEDMISDQNMEDMISGPEHDPLHGGMGSSPAHCSTVFLMGLLLESFSQ